MQMTGLENQVYQQGSKHWSEEEKIQIQALTQPICIHSILHIVTSLKV